MMFDPAKCRDEDLPDGRKSLIYGDAPKEFRADYQPDKVSREMAEMAVRRMVEREPDAVE